MLKIKPFFSNFRHNLFYFYILICPFIVVEHDFDSELHEFRINLNTDTFLGHSVTILNGNIIRQKKIENQLTDIHNAPNGQLAKLQDDFLKLSEINRLLAGAIEVIFFVEYFF